MVGISVYRSCDIIINDVPLLVDLIPLSIQDFDVILGMDWLSSVHAKIDCVLKRFIFQIPNQLEFFFEGKGAMLCKPIN